VVWEKKMRISRPRTRKRRESAVSIDGHLRLLNSIQVFRPNGKFTMISGAEVAGVEVRDGALMILDTGGKTLVVFGQGQWVTVNVQPV
jgi:hypothetical protein